ncbi:MAG: hypothetical protein ABFR75_03455 [Acidobacteriota bacterium]
MEDNILLKIDEKKVPLNHFVQKIFIKVIKGLIGSLDKLPEDMNKVEIIITKEENN